jgi:thioredoxin-related protein
MKFFIFAFIASGALMNAVLMAQSKPSEMRWNSFDAGMEEARVSHKKVLVDIYTDWCGWCKKMDSNVYTDPGIREYLSKNYVIIKMNAEGSGKVHYKGQEYSPAQLAAAFGVSGYPSTLFMKENAEPITLLPGYAEAPMFLLVLSFIAEDQYQKKQFSDYLKEKGVKE